MNNTHALVSRRGGDRCLDHVHCRALLRAPHARDIRRRARALSLCMAITLLLLGADPAIAQETRAETIRQQQADKQSVVAPPSRNRGEVIIDRLDDGGFFAGEPRGVYPWLGSVFPGGGLAGGAGVRESLGDDGAVNVFGGYSIDRWRNQWLLAIGAVFAVVRPVSRRSSGLDRQGRTVRRLRPRSRRRCFQDSLSNAGTRSSADTCQL